MNRYRVIVHIDVLDVAGSDLDVDITFPVLNAPSPFAAGHMAVGLALDYVIGADDIGPVKWVRGTDVEYLGPTQPTNESGGHVPETQ
jgi:hypothetical protein